METIIKALQESTQLPVKPFGIDSLDECIIVSPVPQSDTGAVRTWRLELRLITKTLARAEELRPIIVSTLVTVGDNPKLDYLDCYLNGGGYLKDPDNEMIHTIMYFYITTKSEVNING